MITIYGLKTCDSCRKAQKALPEARLRDIRADPLDESEISELLTAFGDALINRASMTWRGLDDTTRAQPPATLLIAHPALMKRPVIRTDEALLLGWTPATRRSLGVG